MNTPQAFAALQRENASLRDQLEEANERLLQLRASMMFDDVMPESLRLTPTQSIILRLLLKNKWIRYDAIAQALYCNRKNAEDIDFVNVIRTTLYHMRKKLARHYILIKNIHGTGYSMTPDSKSILLAMIEKRNAPLSGMEVA